MSEHELPRRRFLALAGAATVTGLAGCSTAQSSDNPEETTTTTEAHSDDESHDESEESSDGHGDEGHGHGGSLEGPSASAEVKMTTTDSGQHFEPHVVWVEQGGTVTWHNESGAHSATAYAPANDNPQLIPDGAAAWDSGMLSEQGATFEHTFETAGVYHYYCIPHETMGMIGSVIVGKPEAHGQPALEEPPESMPEGVREKLHSLNEQCNEALGHTH